MAKISSLDEYAQNVNMRVTKIRDEAGAHFRETSEAMSQRLQVIENYLAAGDRQPPPQAGQNYAPQNVDIGSPVPKFGNEGPPHRSPFEDDPSKTRVQPPVNSAFRDPNQPFRHAFAGAGQGQGFGQMKDSLGQFKINRKDCDLKK